MAPQPHHTTASPPRRALVALASAALLASSTAPASAGEVRADTTTTPLASVGPTRPGTPQHVAARLTGRDPGTSRPTPATPSATKRFGVGQPPRMLVTGDRVAIRQDGRVRVMPDAGRPGVKGFSVYRISGHSWVVPKVARPWVGTVLAPQLFDLAVQPASGRAGRYDVTIHHTGGRPRVPGVTVTSDEGGIARGHLTAVGSRAFGRALAAIPTDGRRAGSPFPGVTRISPSVVPTPLRPRYPMKTLVIRALDEQGRPAKADAVVGNMTDTRRYGSVSFFTGETRVSVPVGTYALEVWVDTEKPDHTVETRLVVLNDVAVTTSGQVVTADARKATARFDVSTQRPAPAVVTGVSIMHAPLKGDAMGSMTGLGADTVVYSTPTSAPRTGRLRYTTRATATPLPPEGPQAAAQPYQYDLAWSENHVPATQRYAVTDGDVETVTASYDGDGTTRVGSTSYDVPVSGLGYMTTPVTTPGTRVHYIGGSPDLAWVAEADADVTAEDAFPLEEAARRMRPGATSAVTWRRGPVAPVIPVQSILDAERGCYACRRATSLTLGMAARGDSDPTHSGGIAISWDDRPVTHVKIMRDATTLVESDFSVGEVDIPVPAARARYSFALDTDSYVSRRLVSTRTRTVLGFTSSAKDTDRAPAAVNCPGCTVLPLVLARVDYPVSQSGTVTAGDVPFTITPSFPQGRRPVKVTTATLSLRPNGYDWTDVPVRPDAQGRLAVRVPIPADLDGRDVDVRVRVTDDSGATFDQTTQRAFHLAAGPAARSHTTVVGTSPFRPLRDRAACAAPRGPRMVRCLARWTPGAGPGLLAPGRPGDATPTAGYTPKDIAAAYGLPAKPTGPARTVAIVDAFDNPRAEADLAVFRKASGLPPCTTKNGCFRKVDQRGGKTYPEASADWGVEIALDIQAASATCPSCKILLVEADEPTVVAMGAATKTAARLGASVISHSYGRDEYPGSLADASRYYRLPGVAQVASSGDEGMTAASMPAVAPGIISVGGTRMVRSGKTFRHTAWEGAGSGCSAWFGKPTWQKDRNCEMRTIADVSALADPSTGMLVYDTYGLDEDNGWIVVGGTSLAAPLVAGMIGRAPTPPKNLASPGWLYGHRSGLRDVVGGSNGECGGDYLCTGLKGYDGPTGLGTPWGLSSL